MVVGRHHHCHRPTVGSDCRLLLRVQQQSESKVVTMHTATTVTSLVVEY